MGGTDMTTSARFESTRFRPLRPEDEQVNPGVYGEELARWLAARLAESEGTQPRVDYEDWAWLVEVAVGKGHAWICCANEYGSDDVWMIDVRQRPRLLGWLRRAGVAPDEMFGLCRRLHVILSSDATITKLEWFRMSRRGEETEPSPRPARGYG
jgi:hypothetical protein